MCYIIPSKFLSHSLRFLLNKFVALLVENFN